ncbi:MAG: type I restriction enzyme HsdR N-terminal domain-containing protein [Sphingobacteriales bacterium]|nr:type I restriction enzyme HsdR N-terminal domain-containing protein [Sphingobacteriales bacterium]
MIKITYPEYPYKIKKEKDREFIFDEIRKLWVRLTPEEWVRQNFLRYLLDEMKYPSSLIAVEKEIKLNELNKRVDIIVYNQNTEPWLMIECKSMDEVLDGKVAMQILRYNIALPVVYCRSFKAPVFKPVKIIMIKKFFNFTAINIFPIITTVYQLLHYGQPGCPIK